MCTAITYKADSFYFGRTLDHKESFGENVIVCPRNFPVPLRFCDGIETHYAIIGIGTIRDNHPLYYDAVNEKGLCAAALNFVKSAEYKPPRDGALNLACFEIIPFVLASCKTVKEARHALETLNITDTAFSERLPAARLHWMIADSEECVVLEATSDGVELYDNKHGVLTNEPPFPSQLRAVEENAADGFSHSSTARFIHAYKTKSSAAEGDGIKGVSRFFHIFDRVSRIGADKERTIYTCCADAISGIYYYTTYGNRAISAVDMHKEELLGHSLSVYPLQQGEKIAMQN